MDIRMKEFLTISPEIVTAKKLYFKTPSKDSLFRGWASYLDATILISQNLWCYSRGCKYGNMRFYIKKKYATVTSINDTEAVKEIEDENLLTF